MSFILDALKKSESDRQRQSGPALFEVKLAPPRSALPLWAVAIAALLAVNLGIVGWLLVRHPAAHSAAPGASAPTAVTAPAARPAAASPGGAASPAAAVAPPAAAPVLVPAAAPTSSAPPPAAGAAPAPGAAADNPGPDDTAPALEPPPATAFGHVQRGTGLGMPLYQQAANAAGAQLPQLRLDLHAYAERPQDRWVMINMHKLHEGDALPGGVRVEHILPEGAVVSYQGSQFLLPRD